MNKKKKRPASATKEEEEEQQQRIGILEKKNEVINARQEKRAQKRKREK